MASYDPAAWHEFAVAHVGASAALLGLVFVGATINLKEVVRSPLLVNRVGEAILLLASVLFGATCVLIPEQSRTLVAVELAVLGVVTGLVALRLQRGARAQAVPKGERGPTETNLVLRRALALATALFLIVAGATLAAEAGGGLAWWAPAVVVAYVAALGNAWVITVEILR